MSKSQHSIWSAAVLGLGLLAINTLAQAQAIPTKVMVRAISRDAKVIGTGVGGVRITIRDAAKGTILAEGKQEGETGNTDLIMVQPHKRGATVYGTPGAAGFLATVMLEQPTVVEVIAEGPLGTPQSAQRASKTLLLVPGQDVVGEGVLLEIHGLTVKLLEPAADVRPRVGQQLDVRVHVTMT